MQYPWEEKIHWSDDSEELSNPPPPKAQDADDDLEWEEDDVWIDSNEDMKGGANGDNNLPGVNKDRSTPMEVEEASKEAGDSAPGIGHSRPDEKVKHVGNTKSDQESGSHIIIQQTGLSCATDVMDKIELCTRTGSHLSLFYSSSSRRRRRKVACQIHLRR